MKQIDNFLNEEFKILCVLRDYCKKHGLKYFLEGGTLLGAARHKGFIPWDDDIDTIMPRPDYNKLLELVKEEPLPGGLIIVTRDSGKDFHSPYMKICNPNTVLYEGDQLEDTGLFIDVFPIDGASNHLWLFKIQYWWMDWLKVLENYAWMDDAQVAQLSLHKRLRAKMCRKLGTQFFRKWLDSIFLRYEYGATRHVSQITWSTIRVHSDFADYDKQVELEFEGQLFTCPSCYLKRLHTMYGDDCMQLPPEEMRHSKHQIRAYWKD